MDESTRLAISKVTTTGPNGSVRGTGFLVGSGLVATALHNVADRTANPPAFFAAPINLEFIGPLDRQNAAHVTTATVVNYDRDADCVLLRCTNPPPSNYKPLILQALARSGGEWETFGFSNMQSLDGLTVNGDVSNHEGRLFGGPAIQLFSKQLAAGLGGDARGLSGGPMLMRNVVTGLMRFVLGPGDHAVGGVVYACPSQFIAALDPSLSVQPMPVVQTLLTDAQLSSLIPMFVALFAGRKPAFENVIRYALGPELEDITDPDRPLEQIVPDVLTWANRQGRGPMEALLFATNRAMPADADLRTFLETSNLSPVLQPVNIGTVIFDVTIALNLLSGMAGATMVVQGIAATYRTDFQLMLQQLGIIEQYKALHNILHDLQFKLDAIELALTAPATDSKMNSALTRYAGEISDLAQDATDRIDGLASSQSEMAWINGLLARSAEMLDVAQPDASAEDRGQVFTSLRSIWSQASPRINSSLAGAAGDLHLVRLVEMIDAVIAKGSPNPQELAQLAQGAAAVGALRVCVAGLIAEHFAWQALSTDLELAKGSIKHQPQGKIFEWDAFQDRLRSLCGIDPGASWSKRLTARLDEWVKATPNAKPDPREKEAGKIAFLAFYGASNDRFYKVDELVKALSEKIVQLSPPLTGLLNAARAPVPAARPAPPAAGSSAGSR